MDTGCLNKLVDRAWEIYKKFSDCDYCVKDTIPILYFGDLQKYNQSPIRIITVALNPSHHEFPKDSPKSRFESAGSLLGVDLSPGQSCYETYLGALNKYFEVAPYSRWFNDGYTIILDE
jgi:hypothetical protein